MEPKLLIDKAFSRAKKDAGVILYSGLGAEKYQKADLQRLDSVIATIDAYFEMLMGHASLKGLSKFQREILKTLIDFTKLGREKRQIEQVRKILKKLHLEYEVKIKFADNKSKSSSLRKAFYGRLVSVLKTLKISEIEKIPKILTTLPQIRDMSTLLIIGFPNVGKSSILNSLCNANVEVKPYPFTTKGILVGYFKNRYDTVQVVDTPGILDRPFEKMNVIEQRAVTALNHLSKNILFVVDPSETCGYSTEQQQKLLDMVKKNFSGSPLIVATKNDLPHRDFKSDIQINCYDEKDTEKLKQLVIARFFK